MKSGSRDALWWWSVSWAVFGAVACGLLFFQSTFPVPGLYIEPGPSWLSTLVWAAFVLGFGWLLGSVPLVLVGLARLRRGWRAVAWFVAGAAFLALEVTVVTGYGVPQEPPTYTGPAVLFWARLAESAGFLLIGAAMAAIPTGTSRTAEAKPESSPAY
jgi:hypothetical protein